MTEGVPTRPVEFLSTGWDVVLSLPSGLRGV